MGIEIRPVADHRGLRECERLQQEIWGFAELGVVPDHLLLTAITGGGCLLGAYDDMSLIGFAFSFVGLQNGRMKHISLQTGVLPEARYRGVGHRLKLAQREFVLEQGIDLITWTFDPLQSANAYFNLHKLSVVARQYEQDFYGDMRDELNRDLPSDRLSVEWWLKAPRVEARIGGRYGRLTLDELGARGAKRVNRTEKTTPFKGGQGEGDGWPVNVKYDLDLSAQKLLVEIPTDISRIKAQNPELAQRWRMETREIFEHYLGREYIVADFITAEEGRGRQGFYLLERAPMREVLSRG